MVVERYIAEVLNGHDLDALEELVADETLKQRARLFLEAFPDLKVMTNLLVAHGDLVAVNLTGHATPGHIPGRPAHRTAVGGDIQRLPPRR